MHQHIFKVGWLLTKKLRTTTTLYYTFFLPGVFLHEFVYWFMAGVLNVRAERAIAWPEGQQIAELRLNFIRLARNTGQFKLALISISPLIVGLIAVWHIMNNVLNLDEFMAMLRNGQISSPGEAFTTLTVTPDFFLWLYIAFTISNTMMPDFGNLKGLRIVAILLVVIGIVLFALGVGESMLGTLDRPLSDGLSLLAGTFAVVIAMDLFVLGVLGALESIIERITGDSATFQNGKLITMTREELQKMREQERLKRERRDAKQRPALPAGPPSVYNLPFPIPEPPVREAFAKPEAITVQRETPAPLPSGIEGRSAPPIISGFARREEPVLSTGTPIKEPDDEQDEEGETADEPKRLSPADELHNVEDEDDEDELDEDEDVDPP
jgi:hypothetical protein